MKEDPKFVIHAVGVVKSDIKEPVMQPGAEDIEPSVRMRQWREHHRKTRQSVSELVIDPQKEELLDGIEGFSHIMVLYWPHLLPAERRNLTKIHPMGRRDMPLTGIFATRSPARPNPVLVTVVRLLERRGNVLRVRGFEAVDGSPIVDIKPHGGFYHGEEKPSVPAWMEQLHRELDLPEEE